MADKGKKNQIIVLEPSTASVKELLGLVREKDMAEVNSIETPEEAIQCLSQSLPCILITSLTDNSVVPLRVQLLKRLESVIKQGALKVYMVSGMKNRQLADLFTQKLGVADYIIDPVPARTMLFKVNLALKAVDNFRKIAEQKKAASEQIVIKKGDGKKAENGKAAAITPKGKPALQMAEDTFLFKNGGVKKAGKKFVVEVEGPDPSTGEWKQHEDKGDAQNAWRWVPNEEKAAQEAGKAPPDGWVHTGDKPAFNEETGKWALSSEKPQLALRKGGKVEAEKIGLDEKGEVVVADDSPAAEANVQKNREKAAVAIKAREELRKVQREEASKKEKTADPLKTLKAEEKKPDPQAKVPGGKPLEESAQSGKELNGRGPKARLALSGGKPAAGPESEGWEEEKGEFKNKLDGKKEQLRSVVDRRATEPAGISEEKLPEESAPPAEASAEKPLSPLDFLKKRKDKLEKDGKARPESDDLYAEGDEPSRPGASIAPPPKEKKKKGSSAIDKLARLKAGLEDEPEEEATEDWQEENGEFRNKLDGKKEELRAVVDRRDGAPQPPRAGKKEKDRDSADLDAAADPVEKRARLDLKKRSLEQMKARLREPLEEEMSAEEEAAVREELGLKNRPEIKVRELAKRKRAAEAERVKALLAEIEEEEQADEDSGDVISKGPSSTGEEKSAGPRAHDLSQEKLKGIRAALDSGDTEDLEEETEQRRRLKDEGKKGKAAGLDLEDQAFYMNADELLPKGNAWESAGDWYVYLGAETRYKGFGQLADLLPLWIFKGDRAPELLGKSNQWRFFGGKPVQAKTAAEVPSDVRDYLLGIRDQLASAAEAASDDEKAPPAAAKDRKEKNKASSLLDKLKRELEEEASPEADEEALPKAGESAAEETSSPAPKTKKRGKSSRDGLPSLGDDPLASLQSEETDQESGDTAEDEAPAAKLKKDSTNASLDALSRLRKKLATNDSEEAAESAPAVAEGASSDSSEAEEPIEKEAGEPESEITEPGSAEPAKKKKNAGEPESALERLRRELEGETEASEDSAEQSAAEGESAGQRNEESPAEAMKRLREKLEEREEPAAEISEETASLAKLAESSSGDGEFGGDRNEAIRRLREKLIEKSENAEDGNVVAPAESGPSSGVQKFLERRKARQRGREKPANPAGERPAAVSVYLGIFVAVSDSLSQESGKDSIPRVLRALEDSFGHCRALCTLVPGTDGMAKVSHAADGGGGISIKLDSGKAEAISSMVGGSEEVVGYLVLQPSGERSEFSESELSTLKRVAAMLWPILARAPGTESKAA